MQNWVFRLGIYLILYPLLEKSTTHITPRHRRYRKWPQPQAGLSVEPRAFEVDTLPSTPQLNAIMDRAMGKVKSMVNELEDEKGKIISKIYKV